MQLQTYAGRSKHVKVEKSSVPKIDPCRWKRVICSPEVDIIGEILTLHARSPACKNQHLDLLTLVTLTCQSQVEYRWNTGPAGQFVLTCYTYNFKCPVSIRLKLHGVFPCNLVTLLCNYMVWTYAGRSKRDVKVEKSSKFAKNWPVQRALKKGNLCSPELDTYSTYFTCTLLPIL